MVKNRVGGSIHSQTIRWFTALALLGVSIGSAQAGVLASCTYCHGMPPKDNIRKGNPHFDSNSSTTVGSHLKHLPAVPAATDCVVCHGTVVSTYDHQNNVINMAPSISGGSYGKGVFFNQTALPVLNATATCSNTTCHGSASPTWGNNTTNATCTKCHGVNGTTPAQYTADNKTAAPGYISTAPVGTGRDTGGATAATAPKVGAHNVHLAVAPNYSAPMACNVCHKDVNPTNASFPGHMNGAGTVVFFGLATTNHPVNPTYNGTSCSNTYCHFGKSIGGYAPATANASVAWTDTAYLTGTPSLTADCDKCHLSPPNASGSHTGTLTITDCNSCHSHVNTDGTFNNKALHVNGLVEASGECIQCHAAVVSSPIAQSLDATVTTRPNIVASFSLASRHIRSRTASPAVTNADCCVCHMEGNVSDGSANPTYHKNGYIELRDPDLGTTIKGVTHSGTTAAPGAYTSTATDARPVRFSRNLGSATLEPDTQAIMVNLCLKCHDSNGANNALARIGANGLQPFGAAIAANPGSNVLNVAGQFASTNRSFHPVLVRQNSGYTNTGGTRMVAPWNGVTKSASTTIYGPLMTCWDCHAPNGTGSVTITTSGIHGGTPNSTDVVPLRGNVYVNGTTAALNLCVICHVVSGGTTNHGTGSAITSSTNGSMTYFQNRCYFCHAASSTRAAATRPTGAGDAHGYNSRKTGTAFTAANHGYAFIRNEGWYANSYIHSIRSIGATTYTPTCGGVGTGGGCSRGSMGNYTPGGVY